jgi:transketolase
MEGVSSEAASLAGHLKLGNIVYIYDNNKITIDGSTTLAFSENVAERFAAYGWHTVAIDGHDHNQIASAIKEGINEDRRPSLIIASTHIGYGSTNKQDTSSSHGSPLGEEEVVLAKQNLGWPTEPQFYVPEEVKKLCQQRVKEQKQAYEKWQEKFETWKKKHPERAAMLENMLSGKIPANLADELIKSIPEKEMATRASSGKIIQKVAELFPGLVGGSADLNPSTLTYISNSPAIAANSFAGRNIHFGVREHAMGAILNGLALHGGFIPYGSTFLVFADYMRPSIRMAAMMGLPVIYILTHDSIFVGEDGPTHQPIEQIASLRAIPNLLVYRPADSLEAALSWVAALENKQGPTVLALSRQTVPNLPRIKDFDVKSILRGGYILSAEDKSKPEVVIVGTGSEVAVALDAKKILGNLGKSVRVVSLPCAETFMAQPLAYRESVIPQQHCPIVVVEAGVTQGLSDISQAPVLLLGIERFGASAPYKILAERFGFTGDVVAKKILNWLENK